MDATRQIAGIVVAFAILSPALPAAAEVGALAYSPSTDEFSSGSSEFYSLRELQIKALEGCTADDCRIIAALRPGECAAVASSDKHYGVGQAQSQAEAEGLAMESCSHGGEDPNCRVIGRQCAKE
jgi:hypothetical protein